ncbi:signal protein [Actinosynnema pretiosum]|uniref:Signal protein n=3 Tax=Actinosynnema TaxID=40566 RepID=A0A290Z2M8_9PSEU|nr:signal protein [Actinosynnema pretiosum]
MNHETMQHFTSGPWIVLMSYVVSVVGSLIGLSCTARARHEETERSKVVWTVLAAFSIGGVGIWLMHFVAMLEFQPGATSYFSAPLTALSALLAVTFMGGALAMITLTPVTRAKLLIAGAVSGLGVAGMHYLGMAAVSFKGTLSYNPLLVVLSVLIAIAAATAALWFTVVVRTALACVAAGLVMGLAVAGMHHTGMAAATVELNAALPEPTGSDVFTLVFPAFVVSGLVVAVVLWRLFTSENFTFGERARVVR